MRKIRNPSLDQKKDRSGGQRRGHNTLVVRKTSRLWRDLGELDPLKRRLGFHKHPGLVSGRRVGVGRGSGGEEAAHQAQRFRTVASEAKEEGKGGVGRGPTFLEECGESVGSAEAV